MPRATPRTPREPLTRERVLHAAVALADEQGLDALSMRRLGQRVGVEAMSLYNHVANKDDVLAGMVELVFAEIEHPPADLRPGRRRCGGPRSRPTRRSCATAGRAGSRCASRASARCGCSGWRTSCAPSARPGSRRTRRTTPTTPSTATSRASRSGRSACRSRPARSCIELAEEFLQWIPADRYPYVVEHAHEHLAPSEDDGRTEFEFGLDLILDGLERLLDAGPADGGSG